jgi:Transcriptional antiterminator
MLNYRRTEILHALFQNEFTSTQKLVEQTKVSLRTLSSEITQINDILSKNGFELKIIMQRGLGYYADYSIEHSIDVQELKRHCTNYLDVCVNTKFGDNPRISWIIRHLLLQQTTTKIEDLCSLLNVSTATLSKDFRIIRQILKKYFIHIETTPYHGMKIIGDELAIRSCLIDFCDIYSFFEDNIFEEYSRKQYNISAEQILTTRLYVYEQCQKFNYTLTEFGFTRVANYLMIIPNRLNFVENFSTVFPLTIEAKKSIEYTLAKSFLKENSDEKELCYLMLILFGNRESSEISLTPFIHSLVPDLENTIKNIFYYGKRLLNFDFDKYPDIWENLTKVLIKLIIRKKYSIFSYDITTKLHNELKKMQGSLSFGLYIFQELGWLEKTDFDDFGFYELVFTIFNSVYNYRNEYQQTNVALVSDGNFSFYNNLLNAIDFSRFNFIFHQYHFYELMYIDYNEYDYVFIPKMNNINKIQFPIPVYEFDYGSDRSSTQQMFSKLFMKRRKLNAISDGFISPQVITLRTDIKNLVANLIEIFFEYGIEFNDIPYENIKKIFHNLIFNLDAQLEQEILFARSYVIYASKISPKMHYIIDLKKTLKIGEKKISTLHFFFLDLKNGPIIIKNADSEIKRLTIF